jgi:26S proteasome regulatory subunit N2
MLQYALDLCMNVVPHKHFRNMALGVLVDLYESLPEPDYESTFRCLVFLNDYSGVIRIVRKLLSREEV